MFQASAGCGRACTEAVLAARLHPRPRLPSAAARYKTPTPADGFHPNLLQLGFRALSRCARLRFSVSWDTNRLTMRPVRCLTLSAALSVGCDPTSDGSIPRHKLRNALGGAISQGLRLRCGA
jgi:hypothetical protein